MQCKDWYLLVVNIWSFIFKWFKMSTLASELQIWMKNCIIDTEINDFPVIYTPMLWIKKWQAKEANFVVKYCYFCLIFPCIFTKNQCSTFKSVNQKLKFSLATFYWTKIEHLKYHKTSFLCFLQFHISLFLAHLSWRLKWAILIKICPLSVVNVVVVVVVVVVNFSHFHLLLQNHWANLNQTWHKASLGKGDSNFFKWRAPPFAKAR